MSARYLLACALVLGTAIADEVVEAESKPVGDIPASVEGAAFFEPFLGDWEKTWKVSKDADFKGRWKHEGYDKETIVGDKGIVVGDAAQKHAVSTLFPSSFVPEKAGLVVQYELQLKNGLQCGGAYMKLLTASDELDAHGFTADTPYTVMFGPDKCGDTNKVHFILRHKSPKTGEWEEKHLVTPPVPNVSDKKTHLYTAIVGTDNSVKILVDNVEAKAVSLTSDTDFKPPINPPKDIDDPEDSKPEDWVDAPKMDEPGAAKPEDWDEDAPLQIEDPKATKPDDWLDDAPDMVADPGAIMPDDWDSDEDGDWEPPLIANPDCKVHGCGEWKAPMITNPDYKGKWSAPKVDNPDYKGVWSPRQISNPNYFVDEKPYAMAPIGGIGIELWTMQDGILFDNILVTADPAIAASVAAKTYVPRRAAEDAAVAAEARKPPTGGGFVEQAKYYLMEAFYYAQENAILVGVTFCIGLIPLIMLCCMGGKKEDEEVVDVTPPPPPAAAQDGEGDEGEEEEEEEEEEEPIQEVAPKKEKKSAGGAKKRTPKAS